MIRRRRPKREVTFSFDSFLDLIANVIGIILRLILVAWVGAKTYTGLVPPEPPPAKEETVVEKPVEPLPEIEDPLSDEIEEEQRRLEQMQILLNRQLQEWQAIQVASSKANEKLQSAIDVRRQLQSDKNEVEAATSRAALENRAVDTTLDEIRTKSEAVAKDIELLRNKKITRKVYQYRTPISRPLLSEQVTFELRADTLNVSRVTLLDVASLQDEMRRTMSDHEETLKTRWATEGVTDSRGAFRLRFTLERKRDILSEMAGTGSPVNGDNFSYRVTRWEAEPVKDHRGETFSEAMKESSEFQTILGRIDPSKTAITFWVYPKSFSLYRQLRNYLHDRGFVVAGRPLPLGRPIAASIDGTASRGQ